MNTTNPPAEPTAVVAIVELVPPDAVVVVQESALAVESQQHLLTQYAPFFKKAQDLVEKAKALTVTDASQLTEMKMARVLRLGLREVRVEAEKKKKTLKEDILRQGRAIDGVLNVLKAIVEPIEEQLEQAEKFAEIQEAKRKADLKARREAELQALGVDTAAYQLDLMAEETYQQVLRTSQIIAKEKEEARQKAEADRIAREKAEAEERERIRQENERLKREAEERERKAAAERKRVEEERRKEREAAEAKAAEAEAARKKLEDQHRKEREEMERKAAEEAARVRAEAEAKAKKEREAREKLEAQLKAAREAEEQKRRDAEEAARKAAAAPDKEKLLSFAATIRGLKVPALATNKALSDEVFEQNIKYATWLEKKAASL
jgi:hypothetical protein